MPEYLTKEEVRQWRSSLERITLEEYAARLGKVIQGEKHTNDMIDKVMASSLNSISDTSEYRIQSEKIQTIALKPIEKKEATKVKKETPVKEVVKNTVVEEKPVKKETVKETVKPVQKEVKEVKKPVEEVKPAKQEVAETVETVEINVTFKKPLIPREQLIFDYLLKNKNIVVYAKDMAALLELPRDYVYKYIKNLRQKLNEEVLFNADNGGYVLKV